MAFNRLHVNDLATATLDDSDQVIIGESNTFKKATVAALKDNILGSSPAYTTDTEPYLMRRTAHTGVVGKCALEKLVGGSIAWNQMIPHTASTGTSAGITFTNNNDGSWTLTGTGSSDNAFLNLNYVNDTTNCFLPNHIYYATVEKSGSTTLSTIGMLLFGAASDGIYVYGARIFKAASTLNARGYARLQVTNGNTINIGTVKLWPQIFDLTQMLGDTIATYVRTLEQNESGSGIAWLKARGLFINTYYANNTGELKSVQATAHVTKDADDNVIGNYPLGSDTLRGIPQLVSNKLKYDGDEKYPDGTIRRRYDIVDLGSLTWNIGGTGTYRRFYTSETNLAKAPSTQNDDVNIICDSYVASSFNTLLTTDKRISINTTGAINISDSAYASSTAAQFKAAMSGVYLVYPLATETTESSTAYQKVQTIDADGTESFTTSSPVPVGHETQTADNVLAALSWLGE